VATIVDKGVRGAVIEAYKQRHHLESKMRECSRRTREKRRESGVAAKGSSPAVMCSSV